MTGRQDFLYGVLAGKAVVHPCGVKIGEALFEKQIHHLLYLLQVDIRRVFRILGEPHQAEAEFLVRNKIHIRSFLL